MDGYHHSLIYLNIVLMDRYSALIMVVVVREVCQQQPMRHSVVSVSVIIALSLAIIGLLATQKETLRRPKHASSRAAAQHAEGCSSFAGLG
jgi:hypothetical protein